MVKKVNTNSPLSLAEFRYLRDRESLPTAYQLAEGVEDKLTGPEIKRIEDDSKKLREIEARRRQRGLSPLFRTEEEDSEPISGDSDEESSEEEDQDFDDEEDDEDEVDDSSDYAGWSNKRLRSELEDRDLPTSGKKSELVARLEEDDG